MKKILLVAAPLAFALAACDGPAEEAGEQMDDVAEAGVAEAQADLADEMGDEATEAAMEERADNLEDAADEI